MGKYSDALDSIDPLGRQNRIKRNLEREIREERAAKRTLVPRLFRYASPQSIPSATWTQVTSWTEIESEEVSVSWVDEENPSAGRIVAALHAGVYFVGAQLAYAANGTGRRGVRVVKNDNTTEPLAYAALNADTGGGNSTFVSCFTLWRLEEGDVLRVDAFQTSGAALDLSTGASRSNFSMYRVSA